MPNSDSFTCSSCGAQNKINSHENNEVNPNKRKSGLWKDIEFTPEEASAILAQIDAMAHPTPEKVEQRRKNWNRIPEAVKRLEEASKSYKDWMEEEKKRRNIW